MAAPLRLDTRWACRAPASPGLPCTNSSGAAAATRSPPCAWGWDKARHWWSKGFDGDRGPAARVQLDGRMSDADPLFRLPDTRISVREAFGIDADLSAPAFAARGEH